MSNDNVIYLNPFSKGTSTSKHACKDCQTKEDLIKVLIKQNERCEQECEMLEAELNDVYETFGE